VSDHLHTVQAQIKAACINAGRALNEVQLIAVSKTWPAEKLSPLIEADQFVFGENKLQELEIKAPALPAHLEWHYIGGLQRNKVRKVLKHSNWIHSIDSIKLLDAINRIAGEEGVRPHLFLQVNIDREESKGGFSPEETLGAVRHASTLPNIALEGLMCIPQAQSDPEQARPSFSSLRSLRDEVSQSSGIPLPSLSMGMSSDFHIAVEEGATHIRVGSALFGARNYVK